MVIRRQRLSQPRTAMPTRGYRLPGRLAGGRDDREKHLIRCRPRPHFAHGRGLPRRVAFIHELPLPLPWLSDPRALRMAAEIIQVSRLTPVVESWNCGGGKVMSGDVM